MGRLLFLAGLLMAGVGILPQPAFAQAPAEPADPKHRLAERVIRLGGQLELAMPDKTSLTARRIKDLPEGEWTIRRIDLGGRARATGADLDEIGKLQDLAELNLSFTRLMDEDLKALADLPGLQRLYLSETAITDAGLAKIVRHKNLKSLDLSGTKITDAGLQELARLPELSRLFLSRTQITGKGVKALSRIPKLSIVHLAGVKLPAADLASLGQLSELRELCITTDNKGLARLKDLPGLKILTVHGSGVSDAGIETLAKLPGLDQLRLSQTAVSERGLEQLKDALKGCRITAHPISRQSAFLKSSGPSQRPVLRWQPGDAKSAWIGMIPRPALLPGLHRWQLETVAPRSEILSVDFSPNGQRIACGTEAGHIRIYDADNFLLEHLIPAHAGGVKSIAWSPEGTRLASAGSDGMVRLWDSAGKPLQVLRGHRGTVMVVAWSPDGQWLASGSWDTTVRLWKADGSSSQVFPGHAKAVLSIAWNPQGTQFATGSVDKTIRLWDLAGKELHVMQGHTDAVSALAWSSRSGRLVSGSWDKTIRFWNPRTGRAGPVLEGHTYRVTGLEWHPETTQFASVGDRTLRLWSLDGTPIRTVKTENDHLLALSWKHDGSEIATGTRFSSILRIINPSTKAERAIGEATNGGASELAWNPDGERIAVGCRGKTIRFITQAGRAGSAFTGTAYNVRGLAWSPDGERLASGGDALLRLWNRQGIPIKAVKKHERGIASVAWSPDGQTIATVSDDGTARLWSPEAKPLEVIKLEKPARCVAFGPGNQTIVTMSSEGGRIWNRDGSPGPVLADPPKSLVSLGWNPQANRIAAGGWSRTFQLWNPDGTTESSQPMPEGILEIAFDLAGARVALGLHRGKLVLAKSDGTERKVWNAHAGPINAIAWHPGGGKIVSAAYDNTLRFWDAETAEPEEVVLLLHEGTSATFTPAGQLLHGETSQLEHELIYLVEKAPGEVRLLSPSEFEKRLTR